MIDKTAFTSGKTMAQQYLERKAAKIEANLNETIKETGRMMIRKNQEAARKGAYISDGSYFGKVPVTPRNIGHNKTMESIGVTKTNTGVLDQAAAKENIIPENSINYLA